MWAVWRLWYRIFDKRHRIGVARETTTLCFAFTVAATTDGDHGLFTTTSLQRHLLCLSGRWCWCISTSGSARNWVVLWHLLEDVSATLDSARCIRSTAVQEMYREHSPVMCILLGRVFEAGGLASSPITALSALYLGRRVSTRSSIADSLTSKSSDSCSSSTMRPCFLS